MQSLFRALPSVDACLNVLKARANFSDAVPRAMQREAVVQFLDTVRKDIKEGKVTEARGLEELWSSLVAFVKEATRSRVRRVVNGTGVVIHTNMGRSVLPESAVAAVTQVAASYSNLELDLSTGGRGSRQSLVEDLLCRITGAEAAMVVNNNAAAVLLILDAMCKGREVIVSRGQLVEIGGSFRIPEVLERSGAFLREVGATNRTHARDYAQAINDKTAALLRVHTSNYRIVGFHKEVSLHEMVALGQEYNVPVIEDLGSGTLADLQSCGLPGEPTVQDVVRAGVDVVSFSGDKVLGGPQAGIIVGKKAYVDAMRVNPLHRALRCDKFTLAALEATLRIYTDIESALTHIPTLRMITMSPEVLEHKAQALTEALHTHLGERVDFHMQKDVSRVGGGSFPERDLPTTLVCLTPRAMSATDMKERLLRTEPPVIGRLEGDSFCIDPRTLLEHDTALLLHSLTEALDGENNLS